MSRRFAMLPRRKFVRLRGSKIEFAVGLLLASFLQARAAEAATVNNLPTTDLVPNAEPAAAPKLPEWLANLDEDALEQMSPEELKALLGADTLAQLGLDPAQFAKLLDSDLEEAIRQLETAFRNKLKAAAAQAAAIEDGDIRAAATESTEGHYDDAASALGEGVPLLWVIGGLAALGGLGFAVFGGDSNDDPEAVNDSFTTNEDTALTFDVRTNDSDDDDDSLTVTHINGTAITTTSPVAITGGTVSLGADGRLTFTPNANYNGTPSFTYTISDGNGGTADGSVALTVTAVNDAPVAVADTFTTAEDTAVTINVRGNDTDVEGNTLTVTQVNGTAITATAPVTVTGGVVSLVNGNLVFTPSANFNGTPSFTYTISDGNGGTSTATVSGTVTAVNDAPIAVADTFTTLEDTAVTINVRGNDTDVEGNALTVTQVNGTAITATAPVTVTGGVVTLVNGNLVFTPSANFNGTPSFTYTVSDGNGGTATATVSGTVTAVNDAPVAVADTFTVAEDTAVTINVRANDTDVDGDTLTVTQVNGTAINATTPVAVTGGVVTLVGGNLVFTPNANFNGTPSFTYTVADSAGSTSTATVSGTVTAVNDAPVAVADTFTVAEDTAVTINVRGNDTDVDGDTLTVTQVNGTAINATTPVTVTGGVVTLVGGNLVFTPSANFNGTPSFTYTVADSAGATSTATVSGTVTPVNDAPVNNVPGAVSVLQGGAVAVAGLSVSDVDGGTVTTTISVQNGLLSFGEVVGGATVSIGAPGTFTLTGTLAQVNATLGAVTYRPNDGFTGRDTLTITTTDAGGLTDVDTLGLTVTAVQSGIVQDGYIQGAQVFYDANGNGQFDEGEPVASTNAQGQYALALPIGATGSIIALGGVNVDTGLPNLMPLKAPVGSTVVNPLSTLVANMMESGATAAQAKAAVAASLGLPAGVDVTNFDFLAPGNDPAIALSVQKAATQIAQLVTDAVEAGVDPARLIAALTQATASGAAVDLTQPSVLANVLVSAGASAAVAQSVSVAAAAVNKAIQEATSADAISNVQEEYNQPGADLPALAGDDEADVAIGGTTVIDVLANDVDPEGLELRILSVSGRAVVIGQPMAVAGGTVVVAANGQISFTANPGFVGSTSFEYTVADPAGGSSTGTVNVDVAPDGPVLTVAPNDFGAVFDNAAALAAAGVTTFDIDGDALTVTEDQANALLGAGIDFADSDVITIEAAGTQLNTSLKGLQDLHVDSISVGGRTVLSLDAGVGGLAALNASDLPQFDIAQGDAALDVTLNVDAGSLGNTDLGTLAGALANAGVDHIGVNGNGSLGINLDQANALAGAGIDFRDAADISLNVDAADVAGLNAGVLDRINVDQIDVIDDVATISDELAGDLLDAGIEFADADTITVEASGTQLNTSLKGLQDLHVDSVSASGRSVLSLDVGDGGLGALDASALPQFDVAQTDASLDVTLNVEAGSLGDLDLGTLAGSLAAAGVDHLGVAGDGSLAINLDQAGALAAAGIDFDESADISVSLGVDSLDGLDIGLLEDLNVDQLDIIDNLATISDAQAGDLLEAGLSFAASDVITVAAEGTQLNTSLKGLQDLHVDSIAVAGRTVLSLNAGDGGLAGLDVANLPQFDVAQTDADLDVTLNIEPGDLGAGFDIGTLANSLAGAGIDHIGVNGSGAISLDYGQAEALANAGLDFDADADVTINMGGDQFTDTSAAMLGSLGVDHIDAVGDVTISDAQALDLVNAGIDFAASDSVTVQASGTELNTTLKGLQDLHVDAIEVGAGVSKLSIDAGDLAGLEATDLPQFDTAQADSALDVTLRVDLDALEDLERLAGALREAGVDHFGISEQQADLDAATLNRLDALAQASGIDIVYGVQAGSGVVNALGAFSEDGYDHGQVYRELLSTFEASDADQVGDVEITDGTASSLIEAGMLRAYLSDNLVVDATGSGDRLLTTLKEISEIGIDEVRTADQGGAPVYIDLGIASDASAVDEISTLFKNLDLNGPDKLFTNAEKVGLVLDADTATALAKVDGAFDQLADMGFTEVDVLAAPNGFSIDTGSIEVKLIGQDDDLYQHLHHER